MADRGGRRGFAGPASLWTIRAMPLVSGPPATCWALYARPALAICLAIGLAACAAVVRSRNIASTVSRSRPNSGRGFHIHPQGTGVPRWARRGRGFLDTAIERELSSRKRRSWTRPPARRPEGRSGCGRGGRARRISTIRSKEGEGQRGEIAAAHTRLSDRFRRATSRRRRGPGPKARAGSRPARSSAMWRGDLRGRERVPGR
jgi:hypothetical protein